MSRRATRKAGETRSSSSELPLNSFQWKLMPQLSPARPPGRAKEGRTPVDGKGMGGAITEQSGKGLKVPGLPQVIQLHSAVVQLDDGGVLSQPFPAPQLEVADPLPQKRLFPGQARALLLRLDLRVVPLSEALQPN
jgi:hypothetical protein